MLSLFIIDNDVVSLTTLKNFISNYHNPNLVGYNSCAVEALNQLSNVKPPNIIFCNIEMERFTDIKSIGLLPTSVFQ